MRIPERPADLTPEWLTAALEGETVLEFESRGRLTGLSALTERIALTYAPGAVGPQSIIAKFSSENLELRRRSANYLREVRFYQNVAHRSLLRTPHCYYADIDAESGFHVLLLEDLGRSAATRNQCTPQQARLAVVEIAKFHAEWWENAALVELDWIPSPTYDTDVWQGLHDEWWPEFLRRADGAIPPPKVEIAERLGPKRAEIMTELFGGSPRTLIHRDYHHNNMVFGRDQERIPFAVLDWQGMSFGRGVWDVAYFMCQSLDVETRRSIEEELLHAYHDALISGGVIEYKYEQCLKDFRLALLQRFGSLISTIAAMPFSQEVIQGHVDILLPRNFALVLDYNAGELLT